MTVFVFLGPTLPVERARAILDARYLPPVSVGDVCELVLDREPPAAIGIVDGLFEQVPAVWHKEILYAISRGTPVFGASSMGALRAAELCPFGMIGVGEVFEAFRDGRYTDDDEVTIVHAGVEDGYRPLSDAMVNLRAGVARAVADRVIGAVSASVLLGAAKSMYYVDRSWASMCQAGLERGVPPAEVAALRAFVARVRPDVKRDDALALLTRMRAAVANGHRSQPGFDLEPTYYWDKLCATVRNGRSASALAERFGRPFAAIRESVERDNPRCLRDALLDYLLDREADWLGLELAGGQPAAGAEQVFTAVLRRYRAELDAYLLNRMDT